MTDTTAPKLNTAAADGVAACDLTSPVTYAPTHRAEAGSRADEAED